MFEDQTGRISSATPIQQQSSTKIIPTSDNSDPSREITKTFKKRSGTTDRGKDYEHFYLVHLCLKLLKDVNVENFYLSSNNASYGDFDDVIVEIQYENKIETTFAVQLKHKKTKKTARENYLTLAHLNTSDNFKAEKYFRGYCKDLKRLSIPVKMILLTNIKLEVPDRVLLKIQEDHIQVKVSKQDENKFITTSAEEGFCHVFIPTDNVSTDLKEFFEHFYLYTDQLNVDQIKTKTSKIFLDMLKCDESSFNDFVTFITNWSMIEGKKIKLDKILLQRVIALCVLTPVIKPLTITGSSKLCQSEATFREAVSKFHVTRLNKGSYDTVRNLWSNVLNELEKLDEVKKVSNIYQLGIGWTEPTEKGESENKKISKLLWLLGKCPLVVEGCPQIYQIIKLCHQEKFIILDSEENFIKGISQIDDNTSVFNSLENLKKYVQIYDDILNNFTYSIEGQKEETLKNLVEINGEFVSKITTDKLIQMLNNPLLIGKRKEVLPPSHIERTLTRILIDFEFLTNFCSDSVVIASCVKNLDNVKLKVKHTNVVEIDKVQWNSSGNKIKDNLVYISDNEISEELFRTLCSQNSTKTVHHLRYLNESCLEWISSQRGSSLYTPKGHDCFHELAKFRLESEGNKNSIRESHFFSDISTNINIICANPGMGKTSLMKSLKNSSSSRYWTVLIYSRSHSSFFRKKNINAENFMRYIYDEVTKEYNGDFNVNVFESLWKKNRIQIIWDGLDEASDNTFEAILNIVSDISKQGIKQWLTARINLKKRLEETFYVFSRNLNKFNEDEQKLYVKDRLGINDSNELNKTFRIIDSNIRSFSNNTILEIPLQIYMLTELLLRNRDNYLDLLNTTFTILDLYQHFVEEKFKVFYEEKLRQDLSIEYNDMKYAEEKNLKIEVFKTVAYKLHFPNIFEKILSVIFNEKDVINEIKQSGDPVGFIINVNRLDNNDLEFVHNSFGEYFAALYLFEAKRYKARDRRFIYNSRYNNIRFFLDLMVCAKSKAFVAVLYQNSHLLKECTDEDLRIKDDIGRDVLELSCAWSKKYPLIQINEFNETNRLTTNESHDLQYNLISKKLSFFENTISLSQKKILFFLPFLIPLYQSKRQLFNYNVLYYTMKFDVEIIFDCIQNSGSLANAYHSIDKANYLSKVLACNSKRILEKIMMETKYKNVLLESLNILFTRYISDDLGFISSLFQLPNIDSLLNFITIHYVCQKGWIEITKKLINMKVMLDVPDSNGSMPIHYSCQNWGEDAPEIVELLINSNAKLDIPDSNGLMPIHYACQNGGRYALKICQLMINSKTKLDVKDPNGLMPIHYACQDRGVDAVKIVQLLIHSQIKLDVSDSNGLMPIHYACQNKGWFGLKIVQLLINSKTPLDVPDSNGLTPIHYACQSKGKDAFDIVQLLINSQIKLDVPDSNGLMPIHYSCQNKGKDAFEIVQLLINSKTKLNVPDSNGFMPVHYACQNNWINAPKIVELLIHSKSKLDVPDSNGLTPIHYACKEYWIYASKIVELLINSKAKLDIPDSNGLTPIHYACQNKSKDAFEIVQLLINSQIKLDVTDLDGLMPIHYAFQNKGEDALKIVQLLIHSQTNLDAPDSKGLMPIHYACRRGWIEIIKDLINMKVKLNVPNSNGLMPIHYVCQNQEEDALEIVQLLINLKTKLQVPDSSGLMPIHYVCKNNCINAAKIIEILVNLKTKVDLPDSNGLMPIHYACQNQGEGALKIVQLLIYSEIKLDVPDSNGLMPIHYACQNKGPDALEIVQLLINSETKVDVADSNGLMPIHYACRRGWFEIIKDLINMEVKLDVPDSDGLMPIHYACQNRGRYAPEIVRLLINSQTKLDVSDSNGLMPIHYACQNGGVDAVKIVQLLINSKIKPDVPDSNGLMPIHYACQNEIEYASKIAELLINSKAKLNVSDSNGLTPIHYACQNKGTDAFKIVQLLILKTELDIHDSNGSMPIHYACQNKGEDSLKIVQLLIHSQTKLDVPDSKGLMPIHYACQNEVDCASEIVELLLINSETKLDVPDLNGLMPIDYANQNKEQSFKIAEILESQI